MTKNEERQQKIAELTVKEKAKTITREEKVLLHELREAERRRRKNEIMAKERRALEKGKKEALLKILAAVGVKTENQLKSILRFVMSARPDLIPKMPPEEKETNKVEQVASVPKMEKSADAEIETWKKMHPPSDTEDWKELPF